MQPKEIAKDILVALISRVRVPGGGDPQGVTKWVAEAYRIIYEAVLHPVKEAK